MEGGGRSPKPRNADVLWELKKTRMWVYEFAPKAPEGGSETEQESKSTEAKIRVTRPEPRNAGGLWQLEKERNSFSPGGACRT